MNPSHRSGRLLLSFLLLAGLAVPAAAQKPALPQAPTLKPSPPLGMQRGTALELTLTGTGLAEPVAVWTSFPAKTTIPTDGNNGKDAAKLRVRIEADAHAPVGFHQLRLVTRHGISGAMPFCIDDLPQLQENNANRSLETAQAVPVPCVVVGRADAEATDHFRFKVTAGKRLSFAVLGRRLGSKFDPQITLLDPRTGRELPGGYDSGAPGLQTDPRLTYTFKEAGEYVVAVRDVSYRGGADFHYRLRIGDFPCATTPLPMAAKHGSKVKVTFAGRSVEGVSPVELAVPTDPGVQALALAPRRGDGPHGWPVYLLLTDQEERMEAEPNDTPEKAERIAPPLGITGRFAKKGDRDHFVFTAKKGQKFVIDAHTHEEGSPAEVYLVVRDGKGKQLLATNPAKMAPLNFTAPADGDFVIAAEHLLYWAGPVQTYRLTVQPVTPGFSLSLSSDRFRVARGGEVSIPVRVSRSGYAGPIEVSVAGPEGITGKATVPAGQPKKAGQVGVELRLQAGPDVAPGGYAFRVEGRAAIAGKEVVEVASVRAVVSQSLANLPVPPPTWDTRLALAVTEKAPFAVEAKLDPASVKVGKPAAVTVTVKRDAGWKGPVTLFAVGLPANVSAALKPVPADKAEVKGQLETNAKTPPGSYRIQVVGVGTHQGKTFSAVTSVPLTVVK